ncbi:hypothetical protein [Caulobacter sp. RHG1]|uniref:hypothetical protein n=1 Tax=Caulobacter sp. (strain RHG1) TaxID=2545762 RepID=UPI0015544A74|nr:hypothetical protein [Caulobacter sp. RHG1]NQE60974.1 hypothetical protein [Caulobacter sp. RHG1]
MRTAFMTTVLLAAALGLGGCASFEGYPSHSVAADEVSACPVSAGTLATLQRTDYDTARKSASTSDAERRRLRNIFIDSCMGAINASYRAFARELTGDQKYFNVGTDVAAGGFTTAATLAKSARTKTFLAAYATTILGLRSSVDKEVFLGKTLTALTAQMDASRKVVMVDIIIGRNEPDSDYSLDTALLDLQELYEAGSINSAITAVTADAGEKSKEAKAEIKEFRYKSTADAQTDKIYAYFAANTPGDGARLSEIVKCTSSAARMTPMDAQLEALRVSEAGSPVERAEIVGCLKGKNLIQ